LVLNDEADEDGDAKQKLSTFRFKKSAACSDAREDAENIDVNAFRRAWWYISLSFAFCGVFFLRNRMKKF
jgi:hypothetical protein